MTYINITKLIEACDKVESRCTRIAETSHGSAWLFDKLMRYFEGSNALSVTIPVFLNAPVLHEGQATIGRDGSLTMEVIHGEA